MRKGVYFIGLLIALIGCQSAAVEQVEQVVPTDTLAIEKAVSAYKKQASALRDSGLYTDALVYYDSAIFLLDDGELDSSQRQKLGWLWANKGYISGHLQGRILQAKTAYQEASRNLQQSDVSSMLLARHVYKSIGNIYTRLGDYPHAIDYLQRVVDEAKAQRDSVLLVEASNDLAIALLENGQRSESVALLEAGLVYAEGMMLRGALLRSNLGRALFEHGEVVKAADVNREAMAQLTLVLNDSNRAGQHRDARNFMLGCHTVGIRIAGRFVDFSGLRRHRLASEVLIHELYGESGHRKQAKVRLALGDARLDLEQPELALEAYTEAHQLLVDLYDRETKPLYPEQLLISALHGQISSFQKQLRNGDDPPEVAAVYAKYDQLFTLESTVRSELLSSPSRNRHVRQFHGFAQEAVGFSLKHPLGKTSEEGLLKTLDYVSYAHGMLLAESMAEQLISNQSTDSLWLLLMTLDREIADLRSQDATSQRLYQMLQQKAQLIERLKERNPLIYQQWFAPAEHKLADLQQAYVDRGEAVLVYLDQGDSSLILLVGHPKIQQVQLRMDSAFDAEMNAFQQALRNPNTSSQNYQHAAHFLYNRLLQPLGAELPPRLTIVPDGRLCNLPFGLLVTADPQGAVYADLPYFMRNHQISYAPSLGFLQQEEYTQRYVEQVHFFRPDFSCDETLSVLPALAIGIDLSTDESKVGASVKDFLAHSGRAQISHLATHGFAADSGQASWVAFSDSTGCQHRKLYFDQIQSRRYQSDLLVLQACQTGSGTVLLGEGLQSMAQGFLHAGCHNVLASGWNANPASTSQVLSIFYEQLDGQNLAASLQRAQLAYLVNESTDEASAHPYYWGGLHLYGSNLLSGTVEDTKGVWWRIWLGGAVVLLLGFVVFRRVRLRAENENGE